MSAESMINMYCRNIKLNAAVARFKSTLILSFIFSATLECVAVAGSPAAKSAIIGTWKFDYPCAGATGAYADRCAQGDTDNFTISIAKDGNRFCGWYEITAQVGNHVDDGYIDDWTFSNISKNSFSVRFHLSGSSGRAIIRVEKNRLLWTTQETQKKSDASGVGWIFSPPNSAELTLQPNSKSDHPTSCHDEISSHRGGN